MDVEDPKEVVRRGYDLLSEHYERTFGSETKYGPWIEELLGRLPAAGTVLDIGCGTGVPAARSLITAGHRVTGVDISEVQIRRARELVPGADFIRADATTLEFPEESFDAVVCLYALIHIPVEEQPALLGRIASWLRPGGWFLATTGHRAWTGTDENWLGGGAAMWWSHADAATNRSWLVRAGLDVVHEEFVPEGDNGHVLFWARRRHSSG
ncbi:class I SAM-dependent methyltransferase [Streptomyces sp. XY431]|uniref:class I SAM-dependent methyltransferase n=1 Tax=Streptomyces sp. XY431 TaxID=1415562 RepID=UPI0006AD899D|nr:class I SAM-dependent methyltransferase [Streptomyces sp. XY431]